VPLDHLAGRDTQAGTVTVVLETVEVDLAAAADVVVRHGGRHAWSNHGPAVVAHGPGAR